MAADREPYVVLWWEHPRKPGRIMAEVAGFQVYGDTREELDEQVRLAILNRGGDPDRGIRWRARDRPVP